MSHYGFKHILLDVSMPEFGAQQHPHRTCSIYSSPLGDWHWKECDSCHLRCFSLVGSWASTLSFTNDLTPRLGTPHLTSSVWSAFARGPQRSYFQTTSRCGCVNFTSSVWPLSVRKPQQHHSTKASRLGAPHFVCVGTLDPRPKLITSPGSTTWRMRLVSARSVCQHPVTHSTPKLPSTPDHRQRSS